MHHHDYHAVDIKTSKNIEVFIDCNRARQGNPDIEGMEIFPTISIQDGDKLPKDFSVATWGSPLRSVLDTLECILEICPCVIDSDKEKMWKNRLKRKFNSLDLDIHPEELKRWREEEMIHNRILSTNEYGKFFTDFYFVFIKDPDINKSFPELMVMLTHIDVKAKKMTQYYKFSIRNIANFLW